MACDFRIQDFYYFFFMCVKKEELISVCFEFSGENGDHGRLRLLRKEKVMDFLLKNLLLFVSLLVNFVYESAATIKIHFFCCYRLIKVEGPHFSPLIFFCFLSVNQSCYLKGGRR